MLSYPQFQPARSIKGFNPPQALEDKVVDSGLISPPTLQPKNTITPSPSSCTRLLPDIDALSQHPKTTKAPPPKLSNTENTVKNSLAVLMDTNTSYSGKRLFSRLSDNPQAYFFFIQCCLTWTLMEPACVVSKQ